MPSNTDVSTSTVKWLSKAQGVGGVLVVRAGLVAVVVQRHGDKAWECSVILADSSLVRGLHCRMRQARQTVKAQHCCW